MGFLSAIRTFLHLHSPHSSSLPPALFPTRECTMSVNEWASSISDLAENQECRLLRIVHCKAKSALHQEFLLVHIRHPSGKDTIVFADRETSSPGYAEEHVLHARPQMDMQPISIPPSRDRIRLSSDGTATSLTGHISGSLAEIHTVRFAKASKAPSVAHLAVLLTVVHRHMLSSGASAEARSGWFAYCVSEVLKEIFTGASKTNKEWVRVPYGGMKVNGRDTVDTLIREFRPAWEDFARRQPARGGRSTERKPTRREVKKKAQMEPFVDMLRAMNT